MKKAGTKGCIFFSIITSVSFSQDINYCLFDSKSKVIHENDPTYIAINDFQEKFIGEKSNIHYSDKNAEQQYIIPVVFHIIHENGQENISDSQVLDALRIINEDFNKQNADTNKIVSTFAPIAANCRIKFKLATLDPDGNPTTGIDRIINSTETNSGDDGSKLNIWDRAMYLNIWVTKIVAKNSNAAAYTYRPATVSSAASKDGVIIKYSFLGSTGASNYTNCHTLSHEIGHWIDLYHTWGTTGNPGSSSNCNQDDLVNDTPNTTGWTSCNTSGNTCGSLDNVQNFMEYSLCQFMFTEGQKTRMRAAIQSPVSDRSNLWTETNLMLTGTQEPEGVNNKIENNIRLNIYPNPVTDHFIISIVLPHPSVVFAEIINLSGDQVAFIEGQYLPRGLNTIKYENPALKKGFYIIKVTDNKHKYFKKLIVN